MKMMKKFFFLGWCVVDDEDHEEKDGRRMKKMNSTNPNFFLNFFNRRDQNKSEIKIKYSNNLFFS